MSNDLTVDLKLKISPKMHNILEYLCDQSDMSKSDAVRAALMAWMYQQGDVVSGINKIQATATEGHKPAKIGAVRDDLVKVHAAMTELLLSLPNN